MNLAVISMEILCIIILLLILYGSIFEVRNKREKNRIFIYEIILVLCATIFDMFAWIFNGDIDKMRFLVICNGASFILGYFIAILFSYYLIYFIREKKNFSLIYVRIVFVVGICATLFVLVGISNGRVFYMASGYYRVGPWYNYTQIFSIGTQIYNLVLIIMNAKKLGKHDTIAVLSYIVFPFQSVIMHFLVPQISLSYIAITISLLTIYIMLQAEQEIEFRTREKMLKELSHLDAMTQLQNRRSYEESCSRMETMKSVGVVFCDLNGLKYVNDNEGHKAGDQLIKDFADILKRVFSYESIYRISGDEFVILIPDMAKALFEERIEEFKKIIKSNQRELASFGWTCGEGSLIYKLIYEAEKNMYLDKEAFYQRYPEMKR